MALGAFGSLSKIWKSKSISRKTKARLYMAIVISLMLYNAEVWTPKKQRHQGFRSSSLPNAAEHDECEERGESEDERDASNIRTSNNRTLYHAEKNEMGGSRATS